MSSPATTHTDTLILDHVHVMSNPTNHQHSRLIKFQSELKSHVLSNPFIDALKYNWAFCQVKPYWLTNLNSYRVGIPINSTLASLTACLPTPQLINSSVISFHSKSEAVACKKQTSKYLHMKCYKWMI